MRIFLTMSRFLLLVAYLTTISAASRAFPLAGGGENGSPDASYLSTEVLATFVGVGGEVTQDEINQQLAELSTFIHLMQRKRQKYRSERRFLSHFFYKVHRQFLKQYQSHTTLRDLLEQGHYDCVTGTALYALLLDALGISYQIHEFPYHVYLTVTTKEQGTIMIESTDPQYGFVTDATEQAKRQQHYSESIVADDAEGYYQYNFSIQSTIGLTELAGLSYFNEAVEHYNNQEFQQATHLLKQANRWYRSPRTEAFEALIMSVSHR